MILIKIKLIKSLKTLNIFFVILLQLSLSFDEFEFFASFLALP